jgi:hypothetical protein
MRSSRHIGAVVVSIAAVLFSFAPVASAQGALPVFEVTACATDPADAAKLDQFERAFYSLTAYLGWPARMGEADVPLAAVTVEDDLGEAFGYSKSSTARMIEAATRALASLATYRSKLDRVGHLFDAMQRNARFTSRRGVMSLINAGLSRIDAGISELYHAGNEWEASARAFLAYSYDSALAHLSTGALTYGQGLGHDVEGGAGTISSALNALDESASCHGASDTVASMSPRQIDRAAGGGGTQRNRQADLTLLAPKRLRLAKRGATTLPLTVTIAGPRPSMCTRATSAGCTRLELWLTRGKKLVLNLHGTVFKPGAFGLKLRVPRSVGRSTLTLRLAVVPPEGVSPTRQLSVTVRMR